MTNPKQTQRLIALGRIPNANRYGTRHLIAGDEFDASANDAKLLLLAKKAKPAAKREPVILSAPPLIVTNKIAKANRVKREVDPTEQPPAATVPLDPGGNHGSGLAPHAGVAEPDNDTGGSSEPAVSDDLTDELAATREQYQVKLGKRAFHGWDIEELRRRISEAE